MDDLNKFFWPGLPWGALRRISGPYIEIMIKAGHCPGASLPRPSIVPGEFLSKHEPVTPGKPKRQK